MTKSLWFSDQGWTNIIGQAGVHISGTVRLNAKVYCIRDGDNDTWLECPNGPGVDELVNAIERLYNATTEYVDDEIRLMIH